MPRWAKILLIVLLIAGVLGIIAVVLFMLLLNAAMRDAFTMAPLILGAFA